MQGRAGTGVAEAECTSSKGKGANFSAKSDSVEAGTKEARSCYGEVSNRQGETHGNATSGTFAKAKARLKEASHLAETGRTRRIPWSTW
jgi:hypothetical protein